MKYNNLRILGLILGLFVLPLASISQTLHDPVVIVPGILASWDLGVILKDKPVTASTTWELIPIDHTYDGLIKALESEGYVKGKDLFIAFYDWRKSNSDSAVNFLKPTIDLAKSVSGSSKVDIIAHSMGGLVARSYIQSNSYESDVNQLVMIATPNKGSSDIYTLWEGGIIPDSWNLFRKSLLGGYLWYRTATTENTGDPYDTIHQTIPSVGELMPDYKFLIDKSTNKYQSIQPTNPFLVSLKNRTSRLVSRVGGLMMIAGEGEATVGDIPVVGRDTSETKKWSDGKPDPETPLKNTTEGDDKVLTASAIISDSSLLPAPIGKGNFLNQLLSTVIKSVMAQSAFGSVDELYDSGFLKVENVNAGHNAIVTKSVPIVFEKLGILPPTIELPPYVEPEEIDSYWFASPVDVTITSPSGGKITKNSNTIPGATYRGESDPDGIKVVFIENPENGNYKVELTGTADGKYHLAVSEASIDKDFLLTDEKDIKKNEKITYNVNFSTSEPVLSAPVIEQPATSTPATTTPPTIESAVDLLKILLENIEKLYKDKTISKSVYIDLRAQALTARELVVSAGKQKPIIARLLNQVAILDLQLFKNSVDNFKKRKQISSDIASNFITQVNKIISLLK